MNKKELITSISEKTELTKKDVELALNAFIETIEEALENGEKVQLTGFGTFQTRLQKGRTGKINFGKRKGETYTTEDSIVPTFKVGDTFKERVKEAHK